MGSGCVKVTKYFLFLFNLLFLVSIVSICGVRRKAWTKISWKMGFFGFFLGVGPVSSLNKMATVLEGGREPLKLRMSELLCVSQVSQAAPLPVPTCCLQCTQLPPCAGKGKQELQVLSGRRVVVTTFSDTSGAAAELSLSSKATKPAK